MIFRGKCMIRFTFFGMKAKRNENKSSIFAKITEKIRLNQNIHSDDVKYVDCRFFVFIFLNICIFEISSYFSKKRRHSKKKLYSQFTKFHVFFVFEAFFFCPRFFFFVEIAGKFENMCKVAFIRPIRSDLKNNGKYAF